MARALRPGRFTSMRTPKRMSLNMDVSTYREESVSEL